jgi:hypothetical protein
MTGLMLLVLAISSLTDAISLSTHAISPSTHAILQLEIGLKGSEVYMRLLDLWMRLLNKDAEWFETDLWFMDERMEVLKQGLMSVNGCLKPVQGDFTFPDGETGLV